MLILRSASTILGSSEGLSGSTAVLTTDTVLKCSGLKMYTSSSSSAGHSVAVPTMLASTPSISTHCPARTLLTATRYLPHHTPASEPGGPP